MTRIIGWLVIAGFSAYGASQFFKSHVVAEKDRTPETSNGRTTLHVV